MKTETEKAIEFCGNVMYQEDVCDCEEDDLLYNEEMSKVIALLQQGEKYEKMWEELYEVASEFNFFPLMDKLKQRYFPKEAKDNETENS